MTSIFEGIFNIIQGLFQSVFAVIQAFFNVVVSLFQGVFSFVFGVVESIGQFVGASANFVASNILILGLIAVAFVLYRDRNTRGTIGNDLKKKAQ